jgi:hypothetical protein
MFPLFHIAIPLLVIEIPKINKNVKVNRAVLIIASMIPDLIDKPILFLSLGSGRDISHTLLFWTISSILLYLITKRNLPISLSYAVGVGFHLLLDMPHIPLLYPFVQYDFPVTEEPFLVWLKTIFTDPLVISTELIGGVILVFIFFKYNLMKKEKLINFLKTTSNSS